MRSGDALLVLGILARFCPDSARTKNATAKIAAVQKINRAAFDIFIQFVFYAPAFGFFTEAQLTLFVQCSGILRRRSRLSQAEYLMEHVER